MFFARSMVMKKASKITLGLLAVTAAGLLVYRLRRRSAHRRLQSISNEGYETATDILYPARRGDGQEIYGPVLP